MSELDDQTEIVQRPSLPEPEARLPFFDAMERVALMCGHDACFTLDRGVVAVKAAVYGLVRNDGVARGGAANWIYWAFLAFQNRVLNAPSPLQELLHPLRGSLQSA